MKTSIKLILGLFYTIVTFVCAEKDIEKLVDDYARWYDRRSQEASEFIFPTNARIHEVENKTLQEYGKFDFIIIGGGSTGCVIANRLSEIPHWKVLLLEAGSYRDEDYTSVPAWVGLDLNSKFNWGFETIPQDHSLFGTVDRRWRIPKGKGVGGTSLINGLAYSRGDPKDYEKWAQLVNDSSWNYENVLPYFKKSENFTRANFFVPIDEYYHGYEGPLHMTQVDPPQQFADNILKGAEQLGYEIVDYNGERTLGATVLQYYMKDGFRFDPEMGFIAPKRYRRNLKVLDNSYVTKIDFYENKVKGVIFTRNNQTYIARSRKEVVLSAGAISSPQILMVSGIGPREHLESFGIPVVQDLPVGKTLLDHTMTYVVFSSNVTNLTTTKDLEESIKELLLNGKGPLTRLTLSDAAGIFKTPVEQIENYPDVEFMFTDTNNVRNSKFTEEMIRALNPNVSSPFVLQLSLLHQKSIGTVTLKNSDPFEYPLIDPNLLSDEGISDVETLYQGIKLFLDLTETDALRGMNVSLAVKEIPGCNHTEPLSRDFWHCYIRFVTAVGLHEMGTCLSSANPGAGVVDNKLRVFGIQGLRVADASVIPLPVTGHTNAVCTMIGEKVSDFIKIHYKRYH